MAGGIFQVQDNGDLIEMSETPYGAEKDLQQLLAKYPNLLAGDQIDNQDPRRWLLITREMGLPSDDFKGNRWSVDHLFLDQDGVPTLVEVKRGQNTQVRREVVGQILEYAANAISYWPVQRIMDELDHRCEEQGINAEEALGELIGPDADVGDYWDRVETNLQAGRVRLVIVADVIPSELRQIIEFLNQQMDPADIFAIEIKQFVGEGQQTLVPRLIGANEKKAASNTQSKKKWNEPDFLAAVHERRGPDTERITRQLLHAIERVPEVEVWWGEGPKSGNFVPRIFHKGVKHQLFAVRTAGKVILYFDIYRKKPPFADESLRIEFLSKLQSIPVELTEAKITGYPAFDIEDLGDEGKRKQFLEAIEWMIGGIQKS